MAKTNAPRLDHFFSAVAARLDLWRDLNRAAQTWASSPANRTNTRLQTACSDTFNALQAVEDFQAYPGVRAMNVIKERLSSGDAIGTSRLVQRISTALMTRSYRADAGEWESEDDGAANERVMPTAETTAR